MVDRTTYTHCHICEQFCGLEVTARNDRIVAIKPDKKNPYNWRDFCVKAQRAGDVVHHPHRLTRPMRKDGARYVPASHEEAIDDIAKRLKSLIDRFGPNSVAGYLGNPGGFNSGISMFHPALLNAIGSHQQFGMFSIDTNAYHVVADTLFGLEWLALIPDIDATDCAVLIGTNPAVSKLAWLGTVADGWSRLQDRVKAGADLIVVDPRHTETAEKATMHIAPRPESDWAMLLAMLHIIIREGWARLPNRGSFTGFETICQLADQADPQQLAAICDVPLHQIADAARRFGTARRAYVMCATGPALGRNGTITHWLAMVLNLVTARIDVEGGRFMPNWPWSNAVLSAASKTLPVRPSRVRGINPVVGLHSIAELADEITTPGEGQVRALIIAGGNPASSAADGYKLMDAMGQLDLLVALDLFQRESHRDAHWLIPGQHFLERDGFSSGWAHAERPYALMSRAAVASPVGVRPEWLFYRDIADAMGLPLFGGQFEKPTPDAVLGVMFAFGGQIALDDVRSAEHGLEFGKRTLGHLWDHLENTGRSIPLAPPEFVGELERLLCEPARNEREFRLQIISRRRNNMMNGWLAETTGSMLNDETADSIEVNPADAAALGLAHGDRTEIRSDIATIIARVVLSYAIRPGVAVLAQGWGTPLIDAHSGTEVFRKGIERNKLVSDVDLDPLSGVPRLNGTPVTLTKIENHCAGHIG